MSDRRIPYDQIGGTYEEHSRTATMKRAERYSVLRMVGDLEGQHALDCACGSGFYARLLKQHGAAQVIGVDVSPEMIRVAEQQEEADPLGITYKMCDVLELPHLGPFNLITAIWLFNYANSKEKLLQMFQHAYDNLGDNGRLVAYTLNPAFDFRKTNFTKYGVSVASQTFEGDRYVAQGVFVVDPSTPVTVYAWNQDVYEWAIRKVGFREFTWYPSEVSPEDTKEYGKEYWQDFYDNCIGIGLICKK